MRKNAQQQVESYIARQGTFIQAVQWAFVKNWGREGISSMVTLILAAILAPTDFGTVAMAIVYITFVKIILGLGFDTALIQRKDLNPLHLDSVFWLVLILSLVLTGFCIGLSNWWARINHLPELRMVISVLSITIPIQGLLIVQQALFHRQMDFKSLAVRDNVSAFISGVIGVGLALAGFGVWALVGYHLCMAFVSLMLLWRLSQWRPRFRFSAQHAKDLLGFSMTVFLGRLGGYLQGHSDALLMGIFFGPTAVGLYRIADRLMNIPLQLATRAIHTVSLPEFSRFQANKAKLNERMLACIRASSIMTIPALMAIAALSDLLMAIFGPQWAHAADVLKILCVIGAAKSISLFTGTMLQAVSRPRIQAIMVWCLAIANTLLFTIAGLMLKDALVAHQVIGIAALRASLFVILFFPLSMMLVWHFTGITARDLVATVGPSVIAGTSIILGIIGLESITRSIGLTTFLTLIFAGALAIFIGTGTMMLLDKHLRVFILQIWSKNLNYFLHRFRAQSMQERG